jgi:hypothetical protein
MPWNCSEQTEVLGVRLGAGSLRNGRERDPANTRHAFEPMSLGPIGEFGWKADIRLSSLNDASAPTHRRGHS